MTYYFNNPLFPKEAIIEAFTLDYMCLLDEYSMGCANNVASNGCANCPIGKLKKTTLCDSWVGRHKKERLAIVELLKQSHPELLI